MDHSATSDIEAMRGHRKSNWFSTRSALLFWKIGPARNPVASRDSEVKITNQSRERLHEGGPYVIKSRERPLRKGLYVTKDCHVMQTCPKMFGDLPRLT
jgi:hypothetical protein